MDMLSGSVVASSLAAYFDVRTLVISLGIVSLIFTYIVVKEHRELYTIMDTMVATTVGISFLAPRPQNATLQASTTTTTKTSSLEASLLAATDSSSASSASTISSQMSSSSPFDSGYDWQGSTEENYRTQSSTSGDAFFGEFQEFRRRLDRSYHDNYIPSRQLLQDTIIKSLLWSDHNNHCDEPSPVLSRKDCEASTPTPKEGRTKEKDTAPWIVFTAGVYGAGKSHTIGKLQALGCFPPKSSFVGVDPDEIRRMLPEFSLYRADQAGAMTQKEAGMIAELITDIALSSGKNVVVDGSLRDAAWHEGYFRKLRARFGNENETKKNNNNNNNIRIGILYVTAPIDEIYLRVEQRGVLTGRSIPPEFLERSMKEVPEAIERLRPLADFFLHVHNSQSSEEKEEEEESSSSLAGSEQGSFASLLEDANHEEDENSERKTKGEAEKLGKSDLETTIFHEECRSIVGY